MVLDVRLDELLPAEATLLDEAVRLFDVGLATSTVRFTGRDRVALLWVERLETGRDGDGFDCTERDLEDGVDALGAGVDGLLWTDRDADGVDLLAGAGCRVDRLEDAEALDAGAGRCAVADGLADRLGDALGAGAGLVALDGADDRAGWAALGADFVCERPADFELDPTRLLRPNVGTINSEHRNTIPVMRTNCLWFRMSSLLSLTAEPAFAFFHAPFSFSLVSQSCFASENS